MSICCPFCCASDFGISIEYTKKFIIKYKIKDELRQITLNICFNQIKSRFNSFFSFLPFVQIEQVRRRLHVGQLSVYLENWIQRERLTTVPSMSRCIAYISLFLIISKLKQMLFTCSFISWMLFLLYFLNCNKSLFAIENSYGNRFHLA